MFFVVVVLFLVVLVAVNVPWMSWIWESVFDPQAFFNFYFLYIFATSSIHHDFPVSQKSEFKDCKVTMLWLKIQVSSQRIVWITQQSFKGILLGRLVRGHYISPLFILNQYVNNYECCQLPKLSSRIENVVVISTSQCIYQLIINP